MNRINTMSFASRDSYRTLSYLLIACLIILPALLSLASVAAYGVNVPIYDDWTFVSVLVKFYEGRLTAADLISFFAIHRPLFPRIVMLALAGLTNYDTVADMYVSWLFIALMNAVLFYVIFSAVELNPTSLLRFAPVPWITFSFRQWETILWGIELHWYMTNFFVLTSLLFLSRARGMDWRLLVAASAAIAASLSNFSGLLAWPVGLVQILWVRGFDFRGKHARLPRVALVWALVGITVIALYLRGHRTEDGPGLMYFLGQPFATVYFIVLAAGSPFSPTWEMAVVVGAFLVACYLIMLVSSSRWDSDEGKALPIARSLLLFGLLNYLVLVIGRLWVGLDRALLNKYVSQTIFAPVGLYLLLAYFNVQRARLPRILFGAVLGVIVVGLLATVPQALEDGQDGRRVRGKLAYYLSTYRLQDEDNLRRVHWDVRDLKRYAATLEKHKLSVFDEPAPRVALLSALPGAPRLGVDALNGQVVQDGVAVRVDPARDSTIVVLGWAVDEVAGEAAGGVLIEVDGRLRVPAQYGLDRKDVSESLGRPAYRYAGFRAEFATALLKPGPHSLTVMVVSADKAGYYLARRPIDVDVSAGR